MKEERVELLTKSKRTPHSFFLKAGVGEVVKMEVTDLVERVPHG